MINTARDYLIWFWNLIKFMKFARHIQIFHSLYSQDEQEKNYTKGDVSYENLLNPTFAVLANFF